MCTLTRKDMGNYIELIKSAAEDSQALIELKEDFNKDAENMNLNWPRLSMEKRRDLCNQMKTIQTQIADME